jgi:lipopolysaccharide/colanic/teichoic acid biosynthesis glycosyltransferase
MPSPTSRSGQRIYVSICDLLWALASPLVALYLRDADILSRGDWTAVAYYTGMSAGFALLAFLVLRIQDGMTRHFSVHEALDIVEAVLFAELMTLAALFTLTRFDGIPRSMPLIHGLLLAGGLIGTRMIIRTVRGEQEAAGGYAARSERIIVIGANRFASGFIQLLNAYAPQREPVIAVLDGDSGMVGRAVNGVQVFGAPQDLDAVIAEFAIHGVNTDRVVVAGETDLMSEAVLREIERVCLKRQIELAFLPRMLGVTQWEVTANGAAAANGTHAPAVAAVPAVAAAARVSPFFRFKRLIDIVGALVLLILLLPILILGGILVLVDIGPPVFFWQERQGWKGRSFLLYKFRTLRAPFDADGQPILTNRLPSRIGRFLRATRMDELPQLLNVLLGEMSLIGPRPLLPEDQPSNTSIRLAVRPGISGWAQVNGGKLVGKDEKEKLDEWYVRNASLWVDLRIAWMTLAVLLRSGLSPQESSADVEQVQMKGVAAAEQTLLRPERFSAHTSPDLVPRVAETHEKSRVTREKSRVTPEKSRMLH